MLSWVLLLFINNLIKDHENQPSSSGFKRFFPSKNSLSFIKVKSTISFNLPVLYLRLIKNLYPKSLNQSLSVSVYLHAFLMDCFNNTVISNFPDTDDVVALLYLSVSKVIGTPDEKKKQNIKPTRHSIKLSLGISCATPSTKLNFIIIQVTKDVTTLTLRASSSFLLFICIKIEGLWMKFHVPQREWLWKLL